GVRARVQGLAGRAVAARLAGAGLAVADRFRPGALAARERHAARALGASGPAGAALPARASSGGHAHLGLHVAILAGAIAVHIAAVVEELGAPDRRRRDRGQEG